MTFDMVEGIAFVGRYRPLFKLETRSVDSSLPDFTANEVMTAQPSGRNRAI
jgi:hypothetical protein